MYNYRAVAAEGLEYVPVASTEELPNGQRLLIDIGDLTLAVFNIAGRYFAIADVCTHDGGPLAEGEVDGERIECPRHGGEFDLATGKATRPPAVEDIPAYPVRVEGDQILVGVPAG
ncbi:MAG TPA: non-heme iron oxygenase ferredoxin subunit [Anaerolineales bacterium]|nr:non-heme iron oxygenase ferredoxin subunit [Anaerolineales bacterium]